MFPAEQAWMINPHRRTKGRKKMARRKRSHRRKGRMPAALAAYWAGKRKGSNPRRKRRASSRRRARRNQPFIMANPRRRRRSVRHNRVHHRRRGRRNPSLGSFIPSMGFLKEVAFVATGYYGTKISAGFVLPMVGIAGDIPRLAVKSVVAFAFSYVGGMLLGPRVKESLLMGGALEVAQDAIKTYLSPFVPALAAAEMESYYLPGQAPLSETGTRQSTGSYYQVGELPSDNYAG
jgi:hypothetical protein